MKFSIIVPVYNVEKYLRDCLDSIRKQSFTDYEVLLIDDGSNDLSGTICEEYAFEDYRFKVYHKENGGSTSARKMGAANSNGDYILCIDSDDYIQDEYFATIDSLLLTNPDMLCLGIQYQGQLSKNKIENGIYNGSQLFDDYLIDLSKPFGNFGNIIYGIYTKVVKRELFVRNQNKIPDSVVLGEDLLLSGLILRESQAVIVSDYCGYIYRVNNSSITHTYNEKLVKRYQTSLEELSRYFCTEKVNCFSLICLFSIYRFMALQSKSYQDFIEELKKVDYCRIIKKYSDKAVVYKPDFKAKTKIFLDKHKMFRMLYIIYKHRR